MKEFKIYQLDDSGTIKDYTINAIGNYEALKILIAKINFKKDKDQFSGDKIKDSDIYITQNGIAFNDNQYTYWINARIK